MSILVDKNTRLLVQGITGREGTFHTNQMIAFGTNVVGGVVPGKGGQTFDGEKGPLPIYDSVREAAEDTGANASIIFVPAKFAPDAMYEAADAGLPLTPAPDSALLGPLYQWAAGASLEEALRGTPLGPGDLAREARQVLELLEQVQVVAPPAIALARRRFCMRASTSASSAREFTPSTSSLSHLTMRASSRSPRASATASVR